MNNVRCTASDDGLTIHLSGRVDSGNAQDVEEAIKQMVDGRSGDQIVLDLEDLEYVSSAGLRVILRLAKSAGTFKIVNASSAVYEIFDMTGFTEMFEITKAYRRISVEGCEVIGKGANGEVYRIDPDTIVKVYLNPDSLPEIHRERELARTAFVQGIPTAIPYDVVRVGEGYGSVFELLNAKSLGKLLAAGEITVDEAAKMSIDLLKIIHGTVVNPDSMPSERDIVLDWVDYLKDHLEPELWQKLHDLVEAVPEDNHLMHGDYHLKNIMVQNGETLLIDMDTLCHGHPIFELASIYNAYVGFSETDPSIVMKFQGFDQETAHELWHKSLALYLGTDDEDAIRSVEEKATIIGQTRLYRRTLRRDGNPAMIAAAKKHLEELVPKTDTLLF